MQPVGPRHHGRAPRPGYGVGSPRLMLLLLLAALPTPADPAAVRARDVAGGRDSELSHQQLPCSVTGGGGVVDCSSLGLQSLHGAPVTPAVTRHLGFSGNALSRLSEGEFRRWGTLQLLQLDNNVLTAIEPDAFVGLRSLEYLLLQGNRLTALEPAALSGLGSLRVLDLSGNSIATIRPNQFAGTPMLNHLNLYGNQVSTVGCGALAALSELDYLNMAMNPSRCSVTHGAVRCVCSTSTPFGGINGLCAAGPGADVAQGCTSPSEQTVTTPAESAMTLHQQHEPEASLPSLQQQLPLIGVNDTAASSGSTAAQRTQDGTQAKLSFSLVGVFGFIGIVLTVLGLFWRKSSAVVELQSERTHSTSSIGLTSYASATMAAAGNHVLSFWGEDSLSKDALTKKHSTGVEGAIVEPEVDLHWDIQVQNESACYEAQSFYGVDSSSNSSQ